MTHIEFTYFDCNRDLIVEMTVCGTITVTEKDTGQVLVGEISYSTLLRISQTLKDISDNIPSDITSFTLTR